MAAKHDDLNLALPDDRAIYRVRVGDEFAHMKFTALRDHVREIVNPRCLPDTRANLTRLIADHRLWQMGVRE